MNDRLTWRYSDTAVGSILAVLVVFQAIVLSSSSLSDRVRYGLGGAIVVALVLGVAQLSINRRRERWRRRGARVLTHCHVESARARAANLMLQAPSVLPEIPT